MPAKICIYIVASLLLTGCSFAPEDRNSVEYMVFGVYCGECTGHCATMYKIDSTGIQSDTSDQFFDHHFGLIKGRYSFKGYSLTKQSKPAFARLKAEMPSVFLTSKGKTFGSPDAHDQCGVYIQMKDAAGVKEFFIDTDEEEVPDDVNGYTQMLFETIQPLTENPFQQP